MTWVWTVAQASGPSQTLLQGISLHLPHAWLIFQFFQNSFLLLKYQELQFSCTDHCLGSSPPRLLCPERKPNDTQLRPQLASPNCYCHQLDCRGSLGCGGRRRAPSCLAPPLNISNYSPEPVPPPNLALPQGLQETLLGS